MLSYYQKNRLNRLTYQKQYYQENKNKIKEYTHNYYEKNKENLKYRRTQKIIIGNNIIKSQITSNKLEKIYKNIVLDFL